MSNQENKGLVPELRFPEFIDLEPWDCERFDKLYELKVTNSLSRDKLNYETGPVKNIHYGDIHTKFSTLFDLKKEEVPFINPSVSLEKIKTDSYCQEGDMVFADASEDMDDIGKSIELINLDGEKLLAGLHTLLARQIENKLVIGFGGHLFKSALIRKQIQKEAQGAKVLGISGGRIASIDVDYPDDEKEQQKIADCLSSIDELVTAQNQKLEALKTHKKGLMQQLFPAEGEAEPELRFPEFRGEVEWVEEKFGDITHFASGGTPSKDRKEYWGGDIPWISAASMHDINIENSDRNITKLAVEDGARLASKGSLLLLVRGSMLHKRIPIGITKCEVAFNQDVKALSLKRNILEEFLLYLLIASEKRLLSAVTKTGIGAGKLDTNDLKDFLVCIPQDSKEQHKIADCLTSIDELITAQCQKIELLKAHKRGLMQQLFPAVDEVSA